MGGSRIASLAIASALAAGSILTGCGGNDGDGSEALTKQEFVAQANSICKESENEMDAEFAKLGGPPTPEQFRTIVVPRSQGEIDGISELTPPEEDEAFLDTMLEEAQAALDRIDADPSIAFGKTDPFATVNEMANEYGMAACVN